MARAPASQEHPLVLLDDEPAAAGNPRRDAPGALERIETHVPERIHTQQCGPLLAVGPTLAVLGAGELALRAGIADHDPDARGELHRPAREVAAVKQQGAALPARRHEVYWSRMPQLTPDKQVLGALAELRLLDGIELPTAQASKTVAVTHSKPPRSSARC